MFECVGSRSCSRESQGVDGAADKQDLRLSQLTSEILSERKGLRERWDAFEQRCNNTFRQLEVEVTDLKEKHDTFCQLEAEVSDLKDKQQLAIQSSDPSASQIMTVQATLTTFEEKVVGCEGRMAEMTKTLQEMVMGVENKLEKTTSKGGELDTWLEERFAQLASTLPVKSSDSGAVSDDTDDRAHQNFHDPNGLTIVSLDEGPDSSSQINALKEEIAEFRAWRSKVDCVLFDFLPHEPEKSSDKNVLRDAGITVVEGSIQDSKNSLPEDEIGKGNEAPVASESQHTLKGILDDRHGSVRVYPLNESIYDAMVFLFGQTGLPPECSFLIFVGFIFNVVLQIATMIYCFKLFTKQPFDGKRRGRFSYWRSAQGHSLANVDPFSGHSLTARVCGTDDSLTWRSTSKSQ